MKAVIMAGGEGTRLRPLTCGRPKPMVPVANRPVMEYIVDLLKRHGIKDIAVTLQYLPEFIREHFDDGGTFGVKMRYYVEHLPLGTAGSVKNAEAFLNDTFLVISGDALTDVDLSAAVDFHKSRGAIATLVLKRVDTPIEYGVVVTDESGRIVRFLEKPGWGEVFSDTVNTGIYILSPEVFEYIKSNESTDFSKDVFPALLKENKPIFGFISEDYWCDIGDIAAYMQANMDILSGKVKLKIPGTEIKDGIWVGEGTVIEDNARLEAPLVIGRNCYIGNESEIGSFSIIGDNNIIERQIDVKRSIIWRNCTVKTGAQLRGCILCSHACVKMGASIFEQSVIGEYSVVGEQSIIRPNVKIWPDKIIEQNAEVKSNLVWGTKAGQRLFGNRGVTGEINTDITPEFAARLGAVYGSVTGSKGAVGVGVDDSPAARMIASAFISGLLSVGVQVLDFGRLLLPAIRFAVRFYRLNGGIHISACAGKGSRVMLDFLDRKGSSIDRSTEKKIENIFARDDYNRCGIEYVKGIAKVDGFGDFYLRNIINNVKSDRLNFNVAINCSSPFIAASTENMLRELGCRVWVAGRSEHGDIDAGLPESAINGRSGNDANCHVAADRQTHRDSQISEAVQAPAINRIRPLSATEFSSHVKRCGFDLGVSIEESCEKMTLVDKKGRLVTEDMFIALISIILFQSVKGGTVIVPVSASGAVEKLAERFGGHVERAKNATRDIMGRLLDRELKEELLDQFTMHFDAIAGLFKLLDFMAANKTTLSELIDMIPEIHMRRREVECGWNAKGRVIRKIMQEHSEGRIETLEGVKVYSDNGWVLVLPDAERPICSVIGEGISEEFAEELTDIYVRKVREISRS